jgi:hypothetical protein
MNLAKLNEEEERKFVKKYLWIIADKVERDNVI